MAQFTRSVRRWRSGSMILRRVTSALVDAEQEFRPVRGYRETPARISTMGQHGNTGNGQEEKHPHRLRRAHTAYTRIAGRDLKRGPV